MTTHKPTKRRRRSRRQPASPLSPEPTRRSRASVPISSHSTTPEQPGVPRLLTVDEVADLLRTTRKAVYAIISKGALPGVIRLSRRLLIDQADLVEWLHERREVSLTTEGVQR